MNNLVINLNYTQKTPRKKTVLILLLIINFFIRTHIKGFYTLATIELNNVFNLFFPKKVLFKIINLTSPLKKTFFMLKNESKITKIVK